MGMKKMFVILATLLFTWTGSAVAQYNQLTAKEKE